MNRSEFWTIIAAATAVVVLLWTIWSDVAENRRAISKGFIEVRKEVADVHKVLAAIQVSIADLRTEMIRETSQNREDISKANTLIDALEAARERVPAE